MYTPPPVRLPGISHAIDSMNIAHTDRYSFTAASTSTTWVANLAVFVPFQLAERVTVHEWFIYLGTLTTAHNIDFGLYREDFTAIQTLGSTAGGVTASVINLTSNWTNLDLAPGCYYMAFASDTARAYGTSTDAAAINQAIGCVEQTTSSFPLPTGTASPVTYTRAFLPSFGFTTTALGL